MEPTGEEAKAAAFASTVGITGEELANIREMALQQGTVAESAVTGMTGPSVIGQGEESGNETGENNEQETSLAGGVVAGRNDSHR